MSTDPTQPEGIRPAYTATPSATSPSDVGPSKGSEIKLISHSALFYWWPVWALSFLMALITLFEGNRLAVVPPQTRIEAVDAAAEDGKLRYTLVVPEKTRRNRFAEAVNVTQHDPKANLGSNNAVFPLISGESWPGGIFLVGLVLTILVTNVPLRGLWSFLVIVLVIAVSLLFALLDIWDRIFELLGDLHIHINMAGYLTLGLILFGIWALAVFFFDRRTYVIFTPGQVQVCEHIGDAVQSYPSGGIVLEKQRDDLFRHYIYGLGSGDLIIKIGGPDKREVRMPNILFLGLRLDRVQDMMRTVATT